MSSESHWHHLDLKKLLCPLPVIRVQQAIKNLKAGDFLHVVATDPGVMHDIPAWCRIHGHRILRAEKLERELIIEIEILS